MDDDIFLLDIVFVFQQHGPSTWKFESIAGVAYDLGGLVDELSLLKKNALTSTQKILLDSLIQANSINKLV